MANEKGLNFEANFWLADRGTRFKLQKRPFRSRLLVSKVDITGENLTALQNNLQVLP